MKRGMTWIFTATFLISVLVLAGCGPKERMAPEPPTDRPMRDEPEPTPAPDRPSIDLNADPSSVERGGQVTLKWTSSEADSVIISNGIGNVQMNGSLVVTVRESTTYTATAKGPGGEATSSARVTVVDPEPVMTSSDETLLEEAIRAGRVKPVFFAYDKAQLTAQAEETLQANARIFREYPEANFVIEGHCDERGSEEYNLALGERRAQAARDYLVSLGVAAGRMSTISYGEERPFAQGHDESAWRQNRRAHFSTSRR
ncbi:MAG TPA: peptidoglycan-associated lipoprotein Pal [Acidobacteriota bacterium]|nr:peptidoglycan-associated lipoprotein Pal [Acidobacteriota bacterium]